MNTDDMSREEERELKTRANLAAFRSQWRFIRLLGFLIGMTLACAACYSWGELSGHIACLRLDSPRSTP